MKERIRISSNNSSGNNSRGPMAWRMHNISVPPTNTNAVRILASHKYPCWNDCIYRLQVTPLSFVVFTLNFPIGILWAFKIIMCMYLNASYWLLPRVLSTLCDAFEAEDYNMFRKKLKIRIELDVLESMQWT